MTTAKNQASPLTEPGPVVAFKVFQCFPEILVNASTAKGSYPFVSNNPN